MANNDIVGMVCAGGHGTRMGLITRATNKHLQAVFNAPMIFWVLKQFEQCGIQNVLIVSGPEHSGDLMRFLGGGTVLDWQGEKALELNLAFRIQEKPGGIAEAVSLAQDFSRGRKLMVILGDNIFEKSLQPEADAFRKQEKGARVILTSVKDLTRFGVAFLEPDDPSPAKKSRIARIIEKPKLEQIHEWIPPVNTEMRYALAVTGVYFYDNLIWEILLELRPSARGELEITDVNSAYLAKKLLSFGIVNGWWKDAGSPDSLLEVSALVKETGASGIKP